MGNRRFRGQIRAKKLDLHFKKIYDSFIKLFGLTTSNPEFCLYCGWKINPVLPYKIVIHAKIPTYIHVGGCTKTFEFEMLQPSLKDDSILICDFEPTEFNKKVNFFIKSRICRIKVKNNPNEIESHLIYHGLTFDFSDWKYFRYLYFLFPSGKSLPKPRDTHG